MHDKALIRQRLLAAPALSGPERARKSEAICAAIRGDQAWLEAKTIALFAAQWREPEVELLFGQAGTRRFCFPKTRDVHLDFLYVSDPASLVESRWKLREPDLAIHAPVALQAIDLILVPGLAFTRDGKRLGRGGGYYDRILGQPGLRAVRLGVCFQSQILAHLPTEPHDMGVDRVLTEEG